MNRPNLQRELQQRYPDSEELNMARKRLLAEGELWSLPESPSGGHKRQDLIAQAKVSSEVIWCLFGVCSLNDPYRIARPIETKEKRRITLNNSNL